MHYAYYYNLEKKEEQRKLKIFIQRFVGSVLFGSPCRWWIILFNIICCDVEKPGYLVIDYIQGYT